MQRQKSILNKVSKGDCKNKIFCAYLFSLCFAVIFLQGCVYLSHLEEVAFLKSLDSHQKAMQNELSNEENLYNKLKADIDNGLLSKQMPKRKIFSLYGVSVLCRPAQGQADIKETCIYRKPEGPGEIILINFDSQERLYSCEVQ